MPKRKVECGLCKYPTFLVITDADWEQQRVWIGEWLEEHQKAAHPDVSPMELPHEVDPNPMFDRN